MDWKEFFRISRRKVIITTILLALAIYSSASIYFLNVRCKPGGDCPQPFPSGNKFFMGLFFILAFPLAGFYSLGQVAYKSIYLPHLVNIMNGGIFRWSFLILGLVFTTLYLYTLSCIFVNIYDRF